MIPHPCYTLPHVKASPRHWVGYLADDNGSLVLYDIESPDRSPHEVHLYHFKTDCIINHLKYTVKQHLRPLGEDELCQVEKVITAYLDFKLRYFRHLINHRESGFRHASPTEFLGLSHTVGGGPWESFDGDPAWKLIRQEKNLWQVTPVTPMKPSLMVN